MLPLLDSQQSHSDGVKSTDVPWLHMCQVLSTDDIFKSTVYAGIVSSARAVKKETGPLGRQVTATEGSHSKDGMLVKGNGAQRGSGWLCSKHQKLPLGTQNCLYRILKKRSTRKGVRRC